MSHDKDDYKHVPEKENYDDPPAYELPGFGARHIQVLILFISLSVGYTMRAHLSVAMVAMTRAEDNDTICEQSGNHTMHGIDNTEIHNDSTFNFADSEICNGTEKKIRSSWSVYRTYNWSKSQEEMILFAFFVGYTSMMIPMGIIAQKFGGKIPIMIALGANGVLSIITPWIPIFAGWLGVCICRLLQGATQAAFYPSIHTMLGKWAPLSERGRLSTYVYTGSQFGTVIAFQLSGFFCGSPSIGWPSSFWLWGTLSFLCLGLVARFTAASPRQLDSISPEEMAYIVDDAQADSAPKKRPTPWRHILTCPAVWGLVTAHAGSAVGYLFILTQLPLYMDKILGVNIKNNGVLSSLPYIAMYFMSLGFGNLTDFLRNHKLMKLINIRRFCNTVGLVISAIFMLAMSYVNSTWLAVVLLVFSLGLHSGVHTGFHINQIDLAPNFAGPMMALGNMVANLSSLMIPFMMSNIVGNDSRNHFKWQITFIIMAVLQIVTNMVFVVLVKVDLQPWNFYGDDESESENNEEMYVIKNNSIVITMKNVDDK